MVKPQTRGVKCLIECEGKFLLVKLAYAHKKWTLPGGGVDKHESFEDAAWRELQEETGVKPKNLEFIGEYKTIIEGKRDTVQCFYGRTDSGLFKVDKLEISEANWFFRSELPEDRYPRVDEIIGYLQPEL